MASRDKYHDAPEALPPHDPEIINTKSPFLFKVAPSEAQAHVMDYEKVPRRLGDMKASKFWLILALVCALVVAVTVGGAVGGSIASRKSDAAVNSAQNSTTSATSSTTSSSSSGTSVSKTSASFSSKATASLTPSSDCKNNTSYSSLFASGAEGNVPSGAGLTFTKLCATDDKGVVVASAFFFTFEDCIDLCAGLNFWSGDRRCRGVTFLASGSRPTNCWAHNTTSLSSNSIVDSAILA